MQLGDLLKTLNSTKVFATILDSDNSLLVELKANTAASLDDTLEAREVDTWDIINAANIKVILKEATPESESESESLSESESESESEMESESMSEAEGG